MRTRDEVRDDLAALDVALGEFDSHEDGSTLPGVQLMRASLARRREALVTELHEVADIDLAILIDGPGVAGHAVDADVLVKRLSPFTRAVDAIAQALDSAVTAAGVIPASITSQSRVFVSHTFAGSFGLALHGPPREVQLSFDGEDESLFDRSVERLLDVIDAARSTDDYEQLIVDQIADLGERSVSHLLAMATAASTDPNRVELLASGGPRQRRVPLSASTGIKLQTVLTAIESSDHEEPIQGRLVEASLPRRVFGLELETGEIVRGSVDPAIADRLTDYFGHDVEGTVLVTVTRSAINNRSASSRVLRSFAGPLDPPTPRFVGGVEIELPTPQNRPELEP